MSSEIPEFVIESVMGPMTKLVDAKQEHELRIKQLEQKINMLESMLAGEVPKKIERAAILKEALKDEGKITRRQAQNILGNVHHKLALDAMKEAAEQFEHLICTKNNSGVWVLAVRR